MTTVTDKEHLYTNLAGNNTLQKTEEIPEVNGSKISIEKLSFNLLAPKDGLATAWVIAKCDGVETELLRKTTDKTLYQNISVNQTYTADAGKPVTLTLNLKSSKSTAKAKLNTFSYTYSYSKTEEPEEKMNCIMIYCSSPEDAENLAEDLKAHVGDREIKTFVEAANV